MMKTILTALAAISLLLCGCAADPGGSVPAARPTEPSQDTPARFIATAADVQLFGYGPTDRGDGSVGYFMLYVKEFEDLALRLPWNTQISEDEMREVIQAMGSAGFFKIPEKPTPDRKNWRFGIYGPSGRVERYCTKQEFDDIVKAMSKVLPNGFKMKDR